MSKIHRLRIERGLSCIPTAEPRCNCTKSTKKCARAGDVMSQEVLEASLEITNILNFHELRLAHGLTCVTKNRCDCKKGTKKAATEGDLEAKGIVEQASKKKLPAACVPADLARCLNCSTSASINALDAPRAETLPADASADDMSSLGGPLTPPESIAASDQPSSNTDWDSCDSGNNFATSRKALKSAISTINELQKALVEAKNYLQQQLDSSERFSTKGSPGTKLDLTMQCKLVVDKAATASGIATSKLDVCSGEMNNSSQALIEEAMRGISFDVKSKTAKVQTVKTRDTSAGQIDANTGVVDNVGSQLKDNKDVSGSGWPSWVDYKAFPEQRGEANPNETDIQW